jgi:hypothetical protein
MRVICVLLGLKFAVFEGEDLDKPAREIREVENVALAPIPFFRICLVALRH